VDDAFAGPIPRDAYQVLLAPDGRPVWIERTDGEEVRHYSEPGAGLWQRFSVWVLSLLPIESLL